jgi:uncharacterized protein YggE
MMRRVVALSLALGFGGGFAEPAAAEPLKDSVPSVSVVGEAEEEVAPDQATLHFGVVTERPAAAEAAKENARIAATILDELKALGVQDADVRTQGVTLTPVTSEERDPKGKMTAIRKVYVARNDLSVRVRDIQRAGEISGRLMDRGVNSFQGVDYDYSQPEAKMDELRAKAVKDAERRARVYAEAAGLRLSRVLEIRPADETAPFPHPYAMKAAAAPMAEGAPPMRPGLQRISARVSMVWALSH